MMVAMRPTEAWRQGMHSIADTRQMSFAYVCAPLGPFGSRGGALRHHRPALLRPASGWLRLLPWLCLAWLAGLALPARSQPAGVEVFHFWVSGGERASMDAIRDFTRQQGLAWKEDFAPGSGTARYTRVLAARVRAGQVPTAAQMIGYDIHEWARRGLLQNLDDVAAREEWNEVVPDEIQHLSKWEGHWVAAPFNAHSTNWLWVNQALAARLGATTPPDTFSDLIALLERAKAAGIQPLAIGREA